MFTINSPSCHQLHWTPLPGLNGSLHVYVQVIVFACLCIWMYLFMCASDYINLNDTWNSQVHTSTWTPIAWMSFVGGIFHYGIEIKSQKYARGRCLRLSNGHRLSSTPCPDTNIQVTHMSPCERLGCCLWKDMYYRVQSTVLEGACIHLPHCVCVYVFVCVRKRKTRDIPQSRLIVKG